MNYTQTLDDSRNCFTASISRWLMLESKSRKNAMSTCVSNVVKNLQFIGKTWDKFPIKINNDTDFWYTGSSNSADFYIVLI